MKVRPSPRPAQPPSPTPAAEDNDPLTDDAASTTSAPASRIHAPATPLSAAQSRVAAQHRNRHQAPPRIAAVLSSDDGVDSPTYDGDVESSSTAIVKSAPSAASSADTPLASPTFTPAAAPAEPRPPALVLARPVDADPHPCRSPAAAASFALEDIRAFVRAAIDGQAPRKYTVNPPPAGRAVRIYADGAPVPTPHAPRPCAVLTSFLLPGVYDLFHFG